MWGVCCVGATESKMQTETTTTGGYSATSESRGKGRRARDQPLRPCEAPARTSKDMGWSERHSMAPGMTSKGHPLLCHMPHVFPSFTLRLPATHAPLGVVPDTVHTISLRFWEPHTRSPRTRSLPHARHLHTSIPIHLPLPFSASDALAPFFEEATFTFKPGRDLKHK